MRPIDADKLIEKAYWHGDTPSYEKLYPEGHDAVDVWDIENAPTIDAVEVIRCKDCKYCEPVYDLIGLAQDDLACCRNARCVCVHKPNWYCADGERR